MNHRKDGRVAVIDANAMRRELLSRRLRREGYDVFSSDDGRKALLDARTSRVDVVVYAAEGQDEGVVAALEGDETPASIRLVGPQGARVKRRSGDDPTAEPFAFGMLLTRVRAQMMLSRLDPSTGLPNRASAMDHLEAALARTGGHGTCAAVYSLDPGLTANAAGALMADVRARLGALMGTSAVLACEGGSCFTVVAADMADHRAALVFAEQLLSCFFEPFELAQGPTYLVPSMGLALARGADGQAAELLAEAERSRARARVLGNARELRAQAAGQGWRVRRNAA